MTHPDFHDHADNALLYPITVEYLTLEDVLTVVEAELGGPDWVADVGLLSSAVERHSALVFGEEVYTGLHGKGAALMHSLVTNHALIDGNKRVATICLLLFLGLNGTTLAATDDELYDFVISIADGTLRDVESIAKYLCGWLAPL